MSASAVYSAMLGGVGLSICGRNVAGAVARAAFYAAVFWRRRTCFVEAAAVVARAALQKSCERCDRNSDASVRWLGKAGDAAARCDGHSELLF